MSFYKSKHFNFIFLLIFLSILLTNCQRNKVINSHGIMYLENRQELLKINKTNKNDVIKLWVNHIQNLLKRKIHGYILRELKQREIYKLGKEVLISNNVLVVRFDEYGIFKEKMFYNKENMNDYKFAKEETINDIRKGSFVQSFFTKFKTKMRANSPK